MRGEEVAVDWIDAGQGRYALKGRLDFATVATLLQQQPDGFSVQPALWVDLAEVEYCNSAGVALLLAFVREARARRATIQFANPPLQMRDIIHVSGLDGILAGYIAANDSR